MNRFGKILAVLLLGPALAWAQTREETVDFIVKEFRSFERRDRVYSEIQFSPRGDSFKLVRSTPAHHQGTVEFQLKDVDIYRVTHNKPNCVNSYQLLVSPRGREAGVQKNGKKAQETVAITPRTRNGRKCLALERAFTRLTQLTTDRKFLFDDPAR